MPLLEAMACGKFTIATNYSGHTQFCDNTTSLLIEPTGKTEAVDNMWFNKDTKTNCGHWITYNINDMVDHMRSIYQLHQSGISLNQAAINRSLNFTWDIAAKTILDKIKEKCL